MYNVYLGNMLCPVAPEKIQLKVSNKNKTMVLMNGGEINILKDAGLSEISFSLLLPNSRYPFAVYKSGFERAGFFLEQIEKLKLEKKPFQFIIVRQFPDGKRLYNTNIKVSLEDYQIEDNANDGFDVRVSVRLRQYRDYGTKVCTIDSGSGSSTVSTPVQPRSSESSPAPVGQNKTYRVVKGDCMWLIAQKFYGNGNLYEKIYEANKSVLAGRSPRCLIFVGDVLTIPTLDN
ncbi:MAG: LysM peptidoglycan-binding domain-containing protein [Oscillospiraceae bacterium]|nr:LysM peptidoglycan-binding domain-containing protein [Oscillospiraceae bacterium]